MSAAKCGSPMLWPGLSAELRDLIQLYRHLFPGEPLPANVQCRFVAEATGND